MAEQLKPYAVGIGGGSAAGKTFLLNRLREHFGPDELALISLDNYYLPVEQLQRDSKGNVNFDRPDALDWPRVRADLGRLLRGETIEIDEYNFNNPGKPERRLTIHSAPALVLEGLFAFHDSEVVDILDLRVFIEAEEHRKLTRRLKRDTEERAYSINQIVEQYTDHVLPMYRQFVEPHKASAHMVLINNAQFDRPIGVLADHLRAVLSGRKTTFSTFQQENPAEQAERLLREGGIR